jgi:hypothetical protein
MFVKSFALLRGSSLLDMTIGTQGVRSQLVAVGVVAGGAFEAL